MDEIGPLPNDYKRPPGFVLVPGLLGTVPGGDDPIINLSRGRKGGKEWSDHEYPQDGPR